MVRLARRSHYIAAAHRAMRGHLELVVAARMFLILHHFHHFRNHIAAAFHLDPVADLHSQPLDLIQVVQGGARNGRPANRNRLQRGNRRQLPGASHLHQDVFDLGYASTRCVFIRNRPPRSLSGET